MYTHARTDLKEEFMKSSLVLNIIAEKKEIEGDIRNFLCWHQSDNESNRIPFILKLPAQSIK